MSSLVLLPTIFSMQTIMILYKQLAKTLATSSKIE